MLIAISPAAAQMTPGHLGSASCLPQNSIPLNPYPESLPASPLYSLPFHPMLGAAGKEKAGRGCRGRREEGGVWGCIYTVELPGRTHLHLLGIRKQ